MNYLIVQNNHQNIQIRSQNLMLNQILTTDGVNLPPQIPDVPVFASRTIFFTISTSDIKNPPTYEHLRRHLPPEKEEKNKFSIQERFDVIYYNFEFKFSIRGT